MNVISKPPEQSSPVDQASKRQWNERWMLLRDNAIGWRRMAFFLGAIVAVSVVENVHQAEQAKVVPVLIDVNHLGQPFLIGRLDVEHRAPADPNIIKYMLQHWVWDMRTVVADAEAQKRYFSEAYAWMNKGSPAVSVFTEWFEANKARESAVTDTIDVTVEPAVPESPTTWRVNWTEQKRTLKGERDGPPKAYFAVFGISVVPPDTEAKLAVNPIGMFIDTLTWGDR